MSSALEIEIVAPSGGAQGLERAAETTLETLGVGDGHLAVTLVVEEEIVLLDPLAGGGFDPAPLAKVLADPAVEIVLHAGRQDVAIMRREWETDVTNVFDTQVAAGFAGF